MSLSKNYNDLPWQNHSDINCLTLQNSSKISKLINSCSTFTLLYESGSRLCSGSFVTLTNDDLQYGFFMTAYHCVQATVNGGIDQNLTDIYVTNPVSGVYTNININNIYYSGLADIAIIKTNINLTGTNLALKLANFLPTYGDECYMCGNPNGVDTVSVSKGVIRDPNYFTPYGVGVPPSLYVDAPAFPGNSGSPIVNKDGDLIGIFTFQTGGNEELSGGANLDVLKSQFPELFNLAIANSANKQSQNTFYLGINYKIVNAVTIVPYYAPNPAPNQGALITKVDKSGPFGDILNTLSPTSLLLSAIIDGIEYKFGDQPSQHPPGMLVYQGSKDITVKYITPVSPLFNFSGFTEANLAADWTNTGTSSQPWVLSSGYPGSVYSEYTNEGFVSNILTSTFFIELDTYNTEYSFILDLAKYFDANYGDVITINIVYEDATVQEVQKLSENDITVVEDSSWEFTTVNFTPTGKFKFQINHEQDFGNIIYLGPSISIPSSKDYSIQTSQVTLTSPVPVDKDIPVSGNTAYSKNNKTSKKLTAEEKKKKHTRA